MRKKVRRKKGIMVTVKKAAWQVKLERAAKNLKRLAFNVLAVVGLVAVIVLITRAL